MILLLTLGGDFCSNYDARKIEGEAEDDPARRTLLQSKNAPSLHEGKPIEPKILE